MNPKETDQMVDAIMNARSRDVTAVPYNAYRAADRSAASPKTKGPLPALAARPNLGAEDRRFLADLGTSLWRLRRALIDPKTNGPRRGMKPVSRHFNSAWDALRQRGLRVQEHTGDKYDTGQSLVVLAFQPTPGATHEFILETVKPTVYLDGVRIQMGEVVVGAPEPPKAPAIDADLSQQPVRKS